VGSNTIFYLALPARTALKGGVLDPTANKIENAKVKLDEAISLYNSGIKVGHLVFTTEIHK
jgi:hypothetical protein